MKKLYFISFLLMSFILNGQENIFFSEYAEGSSNNKYLEIFNNSAETIDLTQYAFPNVSNAPTTVGEYEYWNTFDDGSTIEPYGIFVIAHPEAEDPILAEADMTSFVYFSNGDDGFKLVYGTEESFTILDEIGDWQGDPGAGWDVAGVTSGTKDHTLVRKSSVQNGNTWSNSAGSTAEDSEWIVYDQNTWTYLGTHEIEASTINFPICEDFEGEDGAAGWTFIDAAGNTTLWTVGFASNNDGTNSTQGIFHGYDSTTPYNDWAVSPSYDTSGLVEGTATVSYDEICNWCVDSEAHNVYYSVDYAGDATTATWVALFEGVNADAEDTWVSSSYSVPSAESVVLAFNYVGTFGANWNVDNVCIDGTLSTTDTELLDMRIYPNPTSSMINVQFDRDIELTLYNMLGQEIMRTNNKQVDISTLQQGNYIVIVRDLESNYVKNFNIIKK